MEHQKIACFLDFDHTLFNTDAFFHRDVVRLFQRRFNIDPKLWDESYREVWKNGYTLEQHIEALARLSDGRVPREAMMTMLREKFTDLKLYVFSDVVPFLVRARGQNVTLFLLSFGDATWQRYKVFGAGLNEYFKDMIFTSKEGGKAEVIARHNQEFGKISMVDNNPSELDTIRDANPMASTYCINRVPPECTVAETEDSCLEFLEARKYLDRPWRHTHIGCTSLDKVLF